MGNINLEDLNLNKALFKDINIKAKRNLVNKEFDDILF